MIPQMTPEDREVFCNAAALGIALGLNHRYEWYTNAQRALGHGLYSEIASRSMALDNAFIAFERTTCGCPEEEKELLDMGICDYRKRVEEFYNAHRTQQGERL